MSKVSALSSITTFDPDDTVYVIRSGASHKGTIGDLFRGFLKFVSGYDGYAIIPGSANTNKDIVETGDILIGKGAFFGGNMVMIVANQDEPTLDAHFDKYLDNTVL